MISRNLLIIAFFATFIVGGLVGYYFGNRGEEECPVQSVERVVTVDTVETIVTTPPRVIYRDRPVPVRTTVRVPVPGDTVRVNVPADDSLRTYHETVNDSLLTGEFDAVTEGRLLEWSFEYQLNVPVRTITVRDSTTVVRTVRPRGHFLAGPGVGFGGTDGQIRGSLNAGYALGSGHSIQYGFNTRREHEVRFLIPIK